MNINPDTETLPDVSTGNDTLSSMGSMMMALPRSNDGLLSFADLATTTQDLLQQLNTNTDERQEACFRAKARERREQRKAQRRLAIKAHCIPASKIIKHQKKEERKQRRLERIQRLRERKKYKEELNNLKMAVSALTVS